MDAGHRLTDFAVDNRTKGTRVAAQVRAAARFGARLRGLIGQTLSPAAGLLIVRCHGVHTFGMRHAIDLAFLDPDGRVLVLQRSCPPNRISAWVPMARYVLEVAPDTLQRSATTIGDQLVWPSPASRSDSSSPGALHQ